MTDFERRVTEALRDDHLHDAIQRATGQLGDRRAQAFASLESAESVRDEARRSKLSTLARLDEALVQFESRLISNGAEVHWARDGEECCKIVLEVARSRQVKSAVKAKSMATEEIHLNKALKNAAIDVLETDLGEYIVQLRDDRPSHIIMPIIHLTREDVGKVFEEKLDVAYTPEPRELASIARRKLRQNFLSADLGITGINFGIVETGGICLVSNEGNIRMCTTLPRIHVVILGIEKLIDSLADLDRMLKLLARSATGQKISVYTSLIHGPRRHEGDEGPEELHVILLDNGRTRVLAGQEAEMLACIRCGACLNVCPVYKAIGGHAYGDTYPGPMGSVLTPGLRGLGPWQELPQASSLCGACRDVCPVRIDMPRMLLELRKESMEKLRKTPWSLRWLLRGFGVIGRHPRCMRLISSVGKSMLRRRAHNGWITRGPGLLAAWTKYRDLWAPAPQTFEQWWRKRKVRNAR